MSYQKKIYISTLTLFCLFFNITIIYADVDFNIIYLNNPFLKNTNYLCIDTNQPLIQIDCNTTNIFDLNIISLGIDSNYFFKNISLYKDTNQNMIFDNEDTLIDVNFSFSEYDVDLQKYDVNLYINQTIDSNQTFFLILNVNTGVTKNIDINVTSIDTNIPNTINYANHINYLITPKLIYQTGYLDQNLLDFNYYFFCDVNNNKGTQSNLQQIIDENQLNIFFENKDFREKYVLKTTDYNFWEYNSLFFDVNKMQIITPSSLVLNLDKNINYFKIDSNYYFLVSDNVLLIYEYDILNNQFSYLSTIDSNDLIYSIVKQDYNSHTYLFLANNGNGISIYDITDENILDANTHFIGNIVFNNNGIDYNTTRIDYLQTPTNLQYIVSSETNTDTNNTFVVLYKLIDLINLNGFVGNSQKKQVFADPYRAHEYFLDVDCNAIYIPYKQENNSAQVVYSYDENTINITASTNSSQNLMFIDSMYNRVFTLSSDFNGISVFDLNNFRDKYSYNTVSLLTSIPLGEHIYSFVLNKDQNKIFVQLKNKLISLDYNFENDSFSIDKNIFISTNLFSPILSMASLSSSLIFSQINNISLFENSLDYLLYNTPYELYYFIPQTSVTDYFSDYTNINYTIYNSFDGNIILSFTLNDYNILKQDSLFVPYTANIFLNGIQDYNIITALDLNEEICVQEQIGKYVCQYVWDIKEIYNLTPIQNGNYLLTLKIPQISSTNTLNFTFNLTTPSGNGNSGGTSGHSSGGHSSGGGSNGGSVYVPSIQISEPEPVNMQDFLDNLALLEKEYINKQNVFNNYLLQLPFINFKIDTNQSFDEFLKDYNEIIKDYENLPELGIKNKILINNFIPDIYLQSIINYQIIDRNIEKWATDLEVNSNHYWFIEINVFKAPQGNQKIVDKINLDKILDSKISLQKQDDNFILVNGSVAYLISQKDYALNQIYNPCLLEETILQESDLNIVPLSNNLEQPKFQSNYWLWIILMIIIAIAFLYIVLNKKKKNINYSNKKY